MTDTVASAYDAVLFDLDGVVYLGPRPIPGAAEAIAALRDEGLRIGFVTNNAARSAHTVAQHLTQMGVAADDNDVITSSQAGARMLTEHIEPGAKVLVVGTAALADEVRAAGFEPVSSAAEQPAAIIQGYDPNLPWPMLDEAAVAIQSGARWFATNTDSTRPTDRGIVPGNGAGVAAVRSAVNVDPLIAGKPYAPLMVESIRRCAATNALFIGDRTDTDIAGAVAAGIDSALVLTGAHGKRDVVTAPVDARPTWLIQDLSELLAAGRTATVDAVNSRCRDQRAAVRNNELVITTQPDTVTAQLDALWAVAVLYWSLNDPTLAITPALDALTDLH